MPKRFKRVGRPQLCRRVSRLPDQTFFKPAGVPLRNLEAHVLRLDELEAMRLVDVEGLYHQEAARRMDVSRATLGRILENARKTVARVLLEGGALSIEGGVVDIQTPSVKSHSEIKRNTE